jgi:hypothetical protein
MLRALPVLLLLIATDALAQTPGEWLRRIALYPAKVDDAAMCLTQQLDRPRLARQMQDEAAKAGSAMVQPVSTGAADPLQSLAGSDIAECRTFAARPWQEPLAAARRDFDVDVAAIEADYRTSMDSCGLLGRNLDRNCKARVDAQYNNGGRVRAAAQQLLDRNRKPSADALASIRNCVAKRDAARKAITSGPAALALSTTPDLALVAAINDEIQADCTAVVRATGPLRFDQNY